MRVSFTKSELQLLYYLLNDEFYSLAYESEDDPLFRFSLKNDRLLRVKSLRDKVELFLEKECE